MRRCQPPLIVSALSVLFLIPSACTWGFGSPEPETNAMHRQFSRTVDIQTGVVLGDLSRAHEAAVRLAAYPEPGESRPDTDPYTSAIRAYASVISQASDLDSVARQVGQIAAACGDCHTAVEGGPRFVLGSGPPQSDTRAAAMIRHLWAADRMWEGLIGPSETAWTSGAEALKENWTASGVMIQASSVPDQTSGYLSQIQKLGEKALSAQGPGDRAQVYAEILGTCNRCHQATGTLAEH